MDFTKKDLRNKDKSLLRRLQRKLDSENIPNVSIDEDILNGKGKSKECYFLEEPKEKKTKLHLFENRRGNRW